MLFKLLRLNISGYIKSELVLKIYKVVSFFPVEILELFEHYFDLLIKHTLENLEELKKEKVDLKWEG